MTYLWTSTILGLIILSLSKRLYKYKNKPFINLTSYLEVIVGPMFSGKTTFLIEIYYYYKKNNINVLTINSNLDNRFNSNNLKSHNGIEIPCIKVEKLFDISNDILNNNDVILINEAQFFTDLLDFVKNLLKMNKIVYVSGLDGDFKRNKFGQILDLIPLSDSIKKLNSTCKICKNNKAIFTHREVKDNQQILVGAEDMYIPICRNCYNNINK